MHHFFRLNDAGASLGPLAFRRETAVESSRRPGPLSALSLIVIYIFFLACPYSRAAPPGVPGASEPGAQEWIPDLTSPEGIFQLIQAVRRRHPGVVLDGFAHQTDIYDVFSRVPMARSLAGDEAADPRVKAEGHYGARFFSEGASKAEVAKAQVVGQWLLASLDLLQKSNLVAKFGSFSEDLAAFGEKKPKDSEMRRYLLLASIAYDRRGQAIVPDVRSLKERIGALGLRDFKSLFFDHFKLFTSVQADELAKLPSRGRWAGTARSPQSLLIDKELGPHLASGGTATDRLLSLEEISPLIAITRGDVTFDCGTGRDPYYVLLKAVRVFYIRKSFNFANQPDGYAMVLDADVGGQNLPYIVSLNGLKLDGSDTDAFQSMLAALWGVDQVVLPELGDNAHLIENAAIATAIATAPGTEVWVELPRLWDAIGKASAFRAEEPEKSPLHRPRLARARLRPVRPANLAFDFTRNEYGPGRELRDLPLVERAILAAQVPSADRDRAMGFLQLNEPQLRAGLRLVAARKKEIVISPAEAGDVMARLEITEGQARKIPLLRTAQAAPQSCLGFFKANP